MMKTPFFFCPICGNVVAKLVDSGVVPDCCGAPMEELVANHSDGKDEYHRPIVEPLGGCAFRISVGYDPHPMTREHHIAFIGVETWRGFVIRHIPVGEGATTTFYLDDPPVTFFAYCNLHGLWATPAPKDAGCAKDKFAI